MNTTENNKLLAEFMGMKIINFKGIEYVENAGSLTINTIDDLESFTYDWNWLIEVVKKIKSIPNKEKFGMLKYEVDVILDVPNAQIVQGYKRMLGDKSNEYFDVICYENDFITNVYNACIAFIEWHNKQTAGEKNKNRKEK